MGNSRPTFTKDTRLLTYEELREAFYQDYVGNERKSLRRDRDGNPRLDKVVRLDDFFSGYRASEIDADLIRKFIADPQARGLSNGSINRSVSALRRMFYLAKEDGKLRDIPTFPMVKEAVRRQGFSNVRSMTNFSPNCRIILGGNRISRAYEMYHKFDPHAPTKAVGQLAN